MLIPPERSPDLVAAAQRSQQLLDAAVNHDLSALDPTVTGRPAGEWLGAVQGTLEHLEGRFGRLVRADVRHALPAPSGAKAVAVYAALTFAKATPLVRLIWDSGRFQRMSDKGAFIGATAGAALVPGPQYMVPTSGDGFTGLRLSTGQTFSGRFLTSKDGCRSLTLSAGDIPPLSAKRHGECRQVGDK